jgi:hypothetical protein
MARTRTWLTALLTNKACFLVILRTAGVQAAAIERYPRVVEPDAGWLLLVARGPYVIQVKSVSQRRQDTLSRVGSALVTLLFNFDKIGLALCFGKSASHHHTVRQERFLLLLPWVYYSGFIFLLRCGIHQGVRSAMDVGKSVPGSGAMLPGS